MRYKFEECVRCAAAAAAAAMFLIVEVLLWSDLHHMVVRLLIPRRL
jgi:hypothetical protein